LNDNTTPLLVAARIGHDAVVLIPVAAGLSQSRIGIVQVQEPRTSPGPSGTSVWSPRCDRAAADLCRVRGGLGKALSRQRRRRTTVRRPFSLPRGGATGASSTPCSTEAPTWTRRRATGRRPSPRPSGTATGASSRTSSLPALTRPRRGETGTRRHCRTRKLKPCLGLAGGPPVHGWAGY